MRGIGSGQRICVFIIPEVKQLIERELKTAIIPNARGAKDHVLEDIVAWLIINSLRSEQTQWVMLCLQNISNLYRKNAFRLLHYATKYFIDGAGSIAEPLSVSAAFSSEDSRRKDFLDGLNRDESLTLFDEDINFDLDSGVPDSRPFHVKLGEMLEKYSKFLSPEQHSIGDRSIFRTDYMVIV